MAQKRQRNAKVIACFKAISYFGAMINTPGSGKRPSWQISLFSSLSALTCPIFLFSSRSSCPLFLKTMFIIECERYLTSLFPCTTAYCDKYCVYSSLKVDQSKGKVQATRFLFFRSSQFCSSLPFSANMISIPNTYAQSLVCRQ